MNINNLLKPYIDEKYRLFHQKICQTKYQIIGVKIPILKNISKNLITKYNYKDIINNLDLNIYEHIMIYGYIISYINIDYNERIKLIKDYLPYIDNWATNDSFISSLKFIKKNKKEYLTFLETIKNKYTRFYIVSLLDYYIDDEYIDYVLINIKKHICNDYYINMSIAWCYQVCFVKYFDKTYNFLLNNKINDFVLNKTISKCNDSLRISKEDKLKIKSLRNMI